MNTEQQKLNKYMNHLGMLDSKTIIDDSGYIVYQDSLRIYTKFKTVQKLFKLKEVHGTLRIDFNTRLKVLDLSELRYVKDDLVFQRNDNLEDIILSPKLEVCGNIYIFAENENVVECLEEFKQRRKEYLLFKKILEL